jgi:hypothetical protein
MKKFKNELAIIGPISLLKAFSEEIKKLGHVLDEGTFADFDEKDKEAILISRGKNYTYGVYNHHDVEYKKMYLPKDWDEALELAAEVEIEAQFKVKPEVGKWYFNGNGRTLFLENEKHDYRSGFSSHGDWIDNCIGTAADNTLRLATQKEVEEALINEAIKRYPIGTRIKPFNSDKMIGRPTSTIIDKSDYSLDSFNYIWVSSGQWNSVIYKNGKWAEVVKEVKVNGYVVTKIASETVKVGCRTMGIQFLKELSSFITYYGGTYNTDGKEWDAISINKVIEEFERM